MFLEHFHPERWTFLWNALSTFSIRLSAGLALLVAGWWLSKRVGNGLSRILANNERVDETLRPILCDIAVWGIRIVAIVGTLSQLGIETASIVAVLGAAGLAIGLALQGTMQNIAAGIMLLLRPFKVGDYIDGGTGVAGTVDEVGLFMTRLTKPDGICEYVPNSSLWGSSIRNYTRNPTRRLDLEVEVSVRDDLDRALDTLRALAIADPDALQDPAQDVMVMRFDDSTAIANMRVWTHTDKFWAMRWRLARQVRKALADADCELPIRTRELHIVHDAERRPSDARTLA
ncbi:mechanosensitive ion channel family protein [Burkholderia sp. Bp8963]|uniref:mechanosensitive ion channel family protein n=1 Tax=Burkholderia sp. Bp8963 TaxID=2184547 RepID=UPI000F5B5B5C|nr:mechanosensitive ion channel family protein [Burkholderia sp. Bp8963]RQS63642.1 mechanosensitive ion channel family protein [Burkholderia sp. Bp8963]